MNGAVYHRVARLWYHFCHGPYGSICNTIKRYKLGPKVDAFCEMVFVSYRNIFWVLIWFMKNDRYCMIIFRELKSF